MLLKEWSSRPKKEEGASKGKERKTLWKSRGSGLHSPTAFSDLGQGRDSYPTGLSDVNPDARLCEAPWAGGRSRNRNSMTELSFPFVSVDGVWV